MTVEVDIKAIKEKALLLLDREQEDAFSKVFDEGLYLDLIRNPEDYLAEGLVSHFINCYE